MIQPVKRVIQLHLPVKVIKRLQKLAESLHVSPSALVQTLLGWPIEPPSQFIKPDKAATVTRHCSRCGEAFQCYPYQRYTTCEKHRGKHLKGFKQTANAHPLKDWKEGEDV